MKRLLTAFLFVLFLSPAYAVDYSEMSTQELIEIMGYVEKKNQDTFLKELKQRVPTMTPQEKKRYEENLQKQKK